MEEFIRTQNETREEEVSRIDFSEFLSSRVVVDSFERDTTRRYEFNVN